MKPLIFEFAELAAGKAEKKLAQVFSRAGSNVVQSTVGPMKRTSGVSYKDVSLTFADGQAMALSVKSSGDIYMVKLNGKVLPIKDQMDHFAAVKEMVKAMDAGRSKFQAALAKTKAALPPGIKSAAPKMEVALKQKAGDLDTAIADARGKVEELRKELGDEPALDSATEIPNGDGITLDAAGEDPSGDDPGEEDEAAGDVSADQGALFDDAVLDAAKQNYATAHKTLSAAVQEAADYAEKNGYAVDGDDWHNEISTGPKKPDEGKTNRYTIGLTKDGKEQKKALQIQVYGKGDAGYELNCYIS